MTTTFFAIWIGLLLFDALLMAGLTWMAHSARYRQYRIRSTERDEIPLARKHINTMLNNLLSLSIFVAFFYFLGETSLYGSWPGVTTLLGEVLGVLLLYDFMYYFFHRSLHHPRLMKYIHGVHHHVRHTTSDKSIYLNPIETMGGLGLLVLSIVILGPISATSFLFVFFLHSVINIIVHSNLVLPHPAFRLFNFWTVRHDFHHHKVRYNYASIFPFWDQAFGTYK